MSRRRRLAIQGFEDYSAYLRSRRWAATKLRYRESDEPQDCRICGSGTVDLHHRSYRRIGHEMLSDLVPLCRFHHDQLHDVLRLAPRDAWYRETNRFIEMRSVSGRAKKMKRAWV